MSNDVHVFELIPEYTLGSLDENEAQQVAEHLAECTACRWELSSYQRVADELLLAVPLDGPSPDLKRRLTARIFRAASFTSEVRSTR